MHSPMHSPVSRTRPFAGSLGPGSYELSHMKRSRGGSISGRLRSASDLEERGVIDRSQKGVLKDLIICGDRELQIALDAYERDDASLLEALMQRGLLNRRDSLDLLHDIDFSFLSMDGDATAKEDDGLLATDGAGARRHDDVVLMDTGRGSGSGVHEFRKNHRFSGTVRNEDSSNGGGSGGYSRAAGASARRHSSVTDHVAEPFDLEEMTFDAAFEDEYDNSGPTSGEGAGGGGGGGQSSSGSRVVVKPEEAEAPAPTGARAGPLLGVAGLGGGSSLVKAELVLGEIGPLPAHRERLEDMVVPKLEAGSLVGLEFSPHFPFSFTDDSGIDLGGSHVGRASPKDELAGLESISEPAPSKRHNVTSPRIALTAAARRGLGSGATGVAGGGGATSAAAAAAAVAAANRVNRNVTIDLRLPTAAALARSGEKGHVGAYSPESRRKRLERFMEKRQHRIWVKTVKYDVRKSFADTRMRVKGRFVKKDDEALLRELMALT